MKVLIAGGGTGGHIYPAIAIAEKIKRKLPESQILFIGARQGMEKDLVPTRGFPIRLIDVKGFSRKNPLKNLDVAMTVFKSIRQVQEIIDEFKPDVAVGFGGYVSGPVIRTAAKSGVRTFIMEQNALPGLANQMAERYAEKVFIAFAEGEKHFKDKDKLVVTGNPIRKEFYAVSLHDYRKKLGVKENEFALLCFGGSLGAKAICEAFSAILNDLYKYNNIKIFFVTGSYYFNDVVQRLQNSGLPFEIIESDANAEASEDRQPVESAAQGGGRVVRPDIANGKQKGGIISDSDIALKAEERIYIIEYSKRLHEYMAAADLIVSRSGALTVSEIAACGKASILIPSPNVTGNHQYFNACTLADRGAAVLIPENDLTPMKLLDIILRLKNNKRRINEMSKACAELGRFDASDIIYDYISAVLPRTSS